MSDFFVTKLAGMYMAYGRLPTGGSGANRRFFPAPIARRSFDDNVLFDLGPFNGAWKQYVESVDGAL